MKEKINYKQVERLETFNGIKLKGNETFDELLQIEKENYHKGRTICKAKNCNEPLYKNQSPSDKRYCLSCA